MKITMPKEVHQVMELLQLHNYQSYLVGGSVRDQILGRPINDWDIATDARPDDVISVFCDFTVIPTGMKHGTVTVLIDQMSIEITTFRTESGYTDLRHPDQVTFVSDIKEDLSRRDFTINAIAYHDDILDPFNGLNDINLQLIRAVGDANQRFNEDPLRILRALRFASELSFAIEEKTKTAMFSNKDLLPHISAERINTEFCKLLVGDDAANILSDYREIISVFIPEITATFEFKQNNPHHYLDVWNHIIEVFSHTRKDLELRLTALFHDIGKPSACKIDDEGIGHYHGHPKISMDMTRTIMNRLRFDKETIHNVTRLIEFHDIMIPVDRKTIKRWINRLGEQNFFKLFEMKEADTMGQHVSFREKQLKEINEIVTIAKNIIEENEAFQLSDLAINGKDLIEIGVEQGSMIGKILQILLNDVIDEKLPNERAQLLQKAAEIKNCEK